MPCRDCGAPLFTEELHLALARCLSCRRDEVLPAVPTLHILPGVVARLDALYRLGRGSFSRDHVVVAA